MSELVIKDKTLYTIANREFYDDIETYQPNKHDFYNVVDKLATDSTVLERYRYWWRCTFKNKELPLQGWKIHVSATPAHAAAITDTVARILIKHQVAFKFVADQNLFSLFNGKSFDRGSAGKFFTIYPQDEAEFKVLIEELHCATLGYWGPYILSDKRYKNSKIIYYRYGGIIAIKKDLGDGEAKHVIQGPDGDFIEDKREAVFNLPEGIQDPFEDELEQEDGDLSLKDGEYIIEKALTFSNAGGVYKATQKSTNNEVVVKEGRPYTNITRTGLDAVQLVKKEHRLLNMLKDTDVTAKPVDFFLDWEHAYMVQEFLGDGIDYRSFFANIYLTLKTQPSEEDGQKFWDIYIKVARLLIDRMATIHDHNIIFGDMSAGNVMIIGEDTDNMEVKIIDFESAYQKGIDLPTSIHTPGFASESYQNMNAADYADDSYAIGALLMSGLFPMNNILMLDRAAHERYLQELKSDIGTPEIIANLISKLMSKEPEDRPTMAQAKEMLAGDIAILPFAIQTGNFDKKIIPELVKKIVSYTEANMSLDRQDRLFPSDPEIFESNPVSIGFGAMGIALTIKQVTGNFNNQAALDWMETQTLAPQTNATIGLFDGFAGIAWGWLELGNTTLATRVVDYLLEIDLPTSSYSVYNGLSGVGLTFLKFWKTLGHHKYLQAAIDIGQTLLAAKEEDDAGTYWVSQARKSSSYGHGIAGIAMFLLYLYKATGDKTYLTTGEKGLNWVIDNGYYNDEDGLTWVARDTTPSYTPYWSWGSSGIGKVFLRYWEVTHNDKYADLIDSIHIDCNRKYTIFSGYFFGCSGITDFYMDLRKHQRWADIADKAINRLFSGTMLFALEREEGIAFPGESASRISCDYGTGSAGVAWMMHRYINDTPAPFMLDDLIPLSE